MRNEKKNKKNIKTLNENKFPTRCYTDKLSEELEFV